MELQFVEESSFEDVNAAADRIKSGYFFDDQEAEQQANLGPNSFEISNRPAGRLLTTLEGTDVAAVRLSSFLVSRRAPYRQWADLFDRFLENWSQVRRVLGNKAIRQLGMRYINRIDVVIPEGEERSLDDFLTVGIHIPHGVGGGPLLSYMTQFERALDNDLLLRLTSGKVDTPVPNSAGVLLDIDILWRPNRVVKDDEIRAMGERMRDWKNEVFELSITDHVREIIR